MLLALRSLFEPEVVIPPVIEPPRIGGGGFAIAHRKGIVYLKTLSLFPVVGKITATGKARTFLEPIQLEAEIQNLTGHGKANLALNPIELTGSIGELQAQGKGDDDEAFFVILDGI